MSTEVPVLLYQSAPKIYPRRAQGRYARLRVAAMLALLGFYYLAPWIQLGDLPLVWFDLPHRRFHVFGLTLVPQDLIYLTWILLIAALTLFFFTSLAGRLWCGYACPQTVWTEAFLWIEHYIEGDRHARIKLDRAPWGLNKVLRKSGKHLAWALFALLTGLTFVAYFVPARQLFPQAWALELTGWPLFWSLFYGFATWGNAGFLREQVCKYMCPYARFQSAMFDKDTLVIAYDSRRGEPRKSLARQLARAPGPAALLAGEVDTPSPAAAAAFAGDCVDCSLCVQVCPTGIDIRKGLQYECIACAACIDACNQVMDSVHKPRGLIRYTSTHQEAGQPFRLLRGRTIGYGAIWLLLCAGLLVALWLRTPLEFDVIRDRHSLYRQIDEHVVENVYAVKVANKDSAPHRFRLAVAAADGLRYQVDPAVIDLRAGEARALTVSVRIDDAGRDEDKPREHHARGIRTLDFSLTAEDVPSLQRQRKVSFIAGDSHDD